jgi:uncharacterized membrane protein
MVVNPRPSAQAVDVEPRPANITRSLLWTGVILGIGLIGSLDEIVLHQLLQWHTFYVHTTPYWRIVSDGIFHFVTAGLLLGGGLWLAWQRPQFGDPLQLRALIAGMLLGVGGFNLYDGTIQHKILQLHPVREGVPNLLPYDLAFNAIAVVLLLLGWWLRRSLQTLTFQEKRYE